MTLGDKIRKYRVQRNLTQKELGKKVGFSDATADSRIRKYESDMMAPKEDIRSRLIEVLDVDPSALSYSQVYDLEDMVRVLFEMEETFGLRIESRDNATSLTFDHSDSNSEKLISYLSLWEQEQGRLSSPHPTSYEREVYENWKAHFPRDIDTFFVRQQKMVDDCYFGELTKAKTDFQPAARVSEFILLLKSMLEAGIESEYGYNQTTFAPRQTYLEIYFQTTQLISLSGDTKSLFTNFLLNLEHMKRLGLNSDIHMRQIGEKTYIGYRLFSASIAGVVYETMQRLKSHLAEADSQNEYGIMRFEDQFQKDLSTYDLDLADEIRHSVGAVNSGKSRKDKK